MSQDLSFLKQLKRRNVFKVGITCVVVARLVAQVPQLVFESFGALDRAVAWSILNTKTGLASRPVPIKTLFFYLPFARKISKTKPDQIRFCAGFQRDVPGDGRGRKITGEAAGLVFKIRDDAVVTGGEVCKHKFTILIGVAGFQHILTTGPKIKADRHASDTGLFFTTAAVVDIKIDTA